MGAWGHGPFENDDAADWVWDLEEAADAAVLHSALDVTGADHLEAPDGSMAIAAAEVVAAALDRPGVAVPETIGQWIGAHQGLVLAKDAQLALSAVRRVRAENSELADLWAEADENGWAVAVDELALRLNGLLTEG